VLAQQPSHGGVEVAEDVDELGRLVPRLVDAGDVIERDVLVHSPRPCAAERLERARPATGADAA
jgi:hypothetical protein